jgi:chromosome segregation ATPase
MSVHRNHIAIILVLGLALAAACGVALRQSRELRDLRQQRDAAQKSLQEAREALRRSQLSLEAALNGAPRPTNENQAELAERDRTIAQLSSQLDEAQDSLKQLQEKLSQSEEENQAALASAAQRYQQLQTEMQDRLDKLQKELDSTRTDLQNARQRIAELKKTNDQLTAANNEGSIKSAEREHILRSLQDIDRRRETYLTSLADRYRNLTSQFRTMSGMLDSSRGQNSSAFSGPALDMIQNAITLADNDLQHLSELNAKAYQLEKQLSKK